MMSNLNGRGTSEAPIKQENKEFWRSQSEGTSPGIKLPEKAVYFNEQKNSLTFDIPENIHQSLLNMSDKYQTKIDHILLSSYVILLCRYSNRECIVIESTLSPSIDNPLILRIDVNEDLSFLEILSLIEKKQCEIMQQRQIDSTELFSETHNQYKQIKFIHPINFTNNKVSEYFEISFGLSSEEGQIAVQLSYNAEMFDERIIESIKMHYLDILEEVSNNPEQNVSGIQLLNKEDIFSIINKNIPDKCVLNNYCVHQLFEKQVNATPFNIAVDFEGEILTYQQLNERANQLAHFLREQGVGPDTLVGIYVERSLEMIIGLLGILKAGGTYVPIDPTYPEKRIEYVLEDTNVSIVLTQENLKTRIIKDGVQVVCLTSKSDCFRYNCDNLDNNTTLKNLIYVIYTSGSTGNPKGVMVQHEGIVNYLTWMQKNFELTHEDKVIQKAPFSFDASIREIFWPLISGAQLIIAKPNGHKDTDYLLELVINKEITTIVFVPSMLKVFLQHEGIKRCTSLKRVFSSGEALSISLQQSFHNVIKADLINLYGPTEASVTATAWKSKRDKQLSFIPIGKSIDNVKVYVLDNKLIPVPTGVPGEMYISSVGLARGYLNQSDLTRQAFVHNPFNDGLSPYLYKTGDIGRLHLDGTIEYLGRKDFQVKVRGFRIELSEIDYALSQYPAIYEAVVVKQNFNEDDNRLVAYIVPRSKTSDLKIIDIKKYLKGKLPEYMIPSSFVFLDELPLSHNGKLDRKALPKPEYISDQEYIEPRTESEKILSKVWCEVLQTSDIGIDDNFFELGGDSILGMQIITKCRKLGLYFNFSHLFNQPTISELSKHIQPSFLPEFIQKQTKVTGTNILTPIQRLFFEKKILDFSHYNMSLSLDLHEELDIELLQKALNHLVDHHDILRSKFICNTANWEHYYDDSINDIPLSVHDFSDLPIPVQNQRVIETANSKQKSLNIIDGPLITAEYFKLHPIQGDKLLIVIHHLIMDEVSWRILIEDLESLYLQLKTGSENNLPYKTTSFQEWALELKKLVGSRKLDKDYQYWRSFNPKRVPFPRDFTNGENSLVSARNISVSLLENETEELLRLVPKTFGCQINDILLAALFITFKNEKAHQNLYIDLEGHGREEIIDKVDLSRTIGWFTSIYPVFIDANKVREDKDLKNLVKIVNEKLQTIPNRGIGFGLLRYLNDSQDESDKLRNFPAAEVKFKYLGQFDQTFNSSIFKMDQRFKGGDIDNRGGRSYILDILAMVTDKRLKINWEYSCNINHQITIQKLADNYIDNLRKMIGYCKKNKELTFSNPEEFPEAKISQKDLNKLMGILSNKGASKDG
ncbi:amino acid adenylation domain-containing protein [Lysinibacillus sp. NPDC056959]|uniref:amino acid adenylation domain-containing protein n=1 Tax=Lysinibacillus sp. NPDC056959 TaxID=3345981 RepID=UPI003625209F